MKRKRILWACVIPLLILLGGMVWNFGFGTTRIGLVNYQAITMGQMAKANNHDRIRLATIDLEQLDDLKHYDMILVNGMGLRITAHQREALRQASQQGVTVLTTMATNPANSIQSADSTTQQVLTAYLAAGGRQNYRNMLTYIRRHVHGMTWDSEEPAAPVERKQLQFYHIDPQQPDEEPTEMASVAAYHAFLQKHQLWKEKASRIIVTGQMGEPTDLIAALEKSGLMVYPVRNMQQLLQGQIDSIAPAAIINMAHGRLGDAVVGYLKRQNIPLFSPLNVNRLAEEWEADKMGMNGGFLSQSIVMPELDGAIRPYALFAHRVNQEGLQELYAMPDRLQSFVQSVNNHIALQRKPNAEKHVVIYYYKGPGQNALTAAGMEVIPSLYHLLVRMKREGYHIDPLPESPEQLATLIQRRGAVYNSYAHGAKQEFLKQGNPLLISAAHYNEWTAQSISPQMMAEVVAVDGKFPGHALSTEQGDMALPRVDLGHVVLMPQLAAGLGEDDFAMVHGTDAAPPHAYIASYLWARHQFKADVMIHLGTHGSLEFTPRKQVALSSNDWPDRLVGTLPHLYIYSIGDVGEGMIAKRRAYATLQSYLTPPFMESQVRSIYKELTTAIQEYNDLLYAEGKPDTRRAADKVKRLTVQLGIHRELRLDSLMTVPYTEQQISRIEAFAEELANEKITGELYTMGQPYSEERIHSSVFAMSVDPIAYSLLALDKQRGKATADLEKHRTLFTRRYLAPARELVETLLYQNRPVSDALICSVAAITPAQLQEARAWNNQQQRPALSMEQMKAMAHSQAKAHPEAMRAKAPILKAEQKDFARNVMEIERTIRQVNRYAEALRESPEAELSSLLNAMKGGYTAPSSGGDPIANPQALPTGRNLYAINAEATPSEAAWEQGKQLADNTIRMYRERHNDSIPRKVSYTLWSGEFVETEGATIAQVLYMLGVEPIRDQFGRVSDIRLIPSKELGRPRIDVVVQTSGQLRDLAASRLFLISRAVEMAAAAKNDQYDNYVSESVVEAERALIEKGLSPKEAREVSAYRVFGGVNGNYGTGITAMVQQGDRWESASEIASVYLNNMGAFYGSEKAWEQTQQYAFEVALARTDAVVQPRQSNTWGALSLDHVYEFMGGMNLAIREVTGKEPDAYLSDYRNHHHMRMQELKEAIGVESRTTLFNPAYIREKMKGGASAASGFAELVQNTYGWNVMRPEAIDDELWNEIYNVYVEDCHQLGIRRYFEKQNPAALQEMTAVMMETVRKGLWQASDHQKQALAQLHTELVNQYKPSCSGAVCDNAKLRQFIASQAAPESARRYEEQIRQVREVSQSGAADGMVLKREQLQTSSDATRLISNSVVAIMLVVAVGVLVWMVRRRRHKMEE